MWGPEDAGVGAGGEVGGRNREETRDSLDSRVRGGTYCRSRQEIVEETENDLLFFFFFQVNSDKQE